jgi:hypothetical protein
VGGEPSLERGTSSLSFGIARIPLRGRVGIGWDFAQDFFALGGLELPILETRSSFSNARAFGLYLRGAGEFGSGGSRTWTCGVAASFVPSGFMGPGVIAQYRSDKLFELGISWQGGIFLEH